MAGQWGQVQLGIGRLRGFGAFALGNTFHEGEEIVVPLTVGVGAQVFAVGAIHNPNISPLPVHLREEGVALVLDGPNDGIERRLMVLLAGRAAEEVVLGSPSALAGGDVGSDLYKATSVAVAALMSQGMRKGGGSMLWTGRIEAMQLMSAFAADGRLRREVNKNLERAYARAKQAIRSNRAAFDQICELLLQHEVIAGDEVDAIVARWRESPG